MIEVYNDNNLYTSETFEFPQKESVKSSDLRCSKGSKCLSASASPVVKCQSSAWGFQVLNYLKVLVL